MTASEEDIVPPKEPSPGAELTGAAMDAEAVGAIAEVPTEPPTQTYAPDALDSTLEEVLPDDEDTFELDDLLQVIELLDDSKIFSGQPGQEDMLILRDLPGSAGEPVRIWLVNDALFEDRLDEFAGKQIVAWCQPIAPETEFLAWNGVDQMKPSQISGCLRRRGKGDRPCVVLIQLFDQSVGDLRLDHSARDLAEAARAANAHVLFIAHGRLDIKPRTVRVWKPDLAGCRLRKLVWEHLDRLEQTAQFEVVMAMLEAEIPKLSEQARKLKNLDRLLERIEDALQAGPDEPVEIAELVRDVLKAPANALDDKFGAILEKVFSPSFASEPKLPVLCETEGPLEPYASILFALHAFHEARVQPERRAFTLFVRGMLEGRTLEVRRPGEEEGKSILVTQDLWGLYEKNARSIRRALEVSYREIERRGYFWIRDPGYQTLGAILNEQAFEYRDLQRNLVLSRGLCVDRDQSLRKVAVDILWRQIAPIETEEEQKRGAVAVAAAFGLNRRMNEVHAAKSIAAQLLPPPEAEGSEPKENVAFIRALVDYLIVRVDPRVGGNFVLRILLERPQLIDFSWLFNNRLPSSEGAAARFLDGVEVLCRRKNTDGTGLQVLLQAVAQRLADGQASPGTGGPDIWAAVAIRLATGVALGLDWKDYQPAAEPTYQSATVRALAGDSDQMSDTLCLLFTRRVAQYIDRVDAIGRAADPAFMRAWNFNERLRLLAVAMRLKCKFPPQDHGGGPGYSGSPFQPPAERLAEEFLQEKEWAHVISRGDTVGFTPTSLEMALSKDVPTVEDWRQNVLQSIPILVAMEVLAMAGISGRVEVASSVKKGIMQLIEARGTAARRDFERFERMASDFYRGGNRDLLGQADKVFRENAVDAATRNQFLKYLNLRHRFEPRIS